MLKISKSQNQCKIEKLLKIVRDWQPSAVANLELDSFYL